MIWWYWAVLGLALLGLEVLTLGGLGNFYFLFFGIAALIVSALAGSGFIELHWLQWVLFSLLGVAQVFLVQNTLQPKRSSKHKAQSEMDTLVGEIATVTEDLPAHEAGQAELRGAIWTVRNSGQEPLRKGQRAKVMRVDGLTLWIQAETPMEEEHHVR